MEVMVVNRAGFEFNLFEVLVDLDANVVESINLLGAEWESWQCAWNAYCEEYHQVYGYPPPHDFAKDGKPSVAQALKAANTKILELKLSDL